MNKGGWQGTLDPHAVPVVGRRRSGERKWSYRYVHDALGWDTHHAALRLGMSLRTIACWKRDGIDDVTADAIAVRLNVHPSQLWPGWHGADVALDEKVS